VLLVLVQSVKGKNMTPETFGMWAFASLAWVVTAGIAVAAVSLVRNLMNNHWMDQQMQLRMLEKIDSGELKIENIN
jgi:hypothetical protein